MKNFFFYCLTFVILLVFSFLTLELSLRTFLTLKHIKNPHVSYWGKTWFRHKTYRLSNFDKNLGSDLIEVEFENVDIPRWKKNSNISINKNKFRKNDNDISYFKSRKKILVTGDSFTFGSQVSNNETWPSYLEKKTGIKVFNGGHPGYSAGQSLKKGILLSGKDKYDYFIWSIIYDDFNRDFINQFIVKKNNELIFNKFKKNLNYKQKEKKLSLYKYFKEISFLVYILDRELISKIKKKDKNQNFLIPLNNGTSNFTKKELVDFLINEFSKIRIKNKFILIQHTDQSDNIRKKLRELKQEKIDNPYSKLLFSAAEKNNIKILDSNQKFKIMTKDEKRLLWFDHHTALGNEVVADFIISKIDIKY